MKTTKTDPAVNQKIRKRSHHLAWLQKGHTRQYVGKPGLLPHTTCIYKILLFILGLETGASGMHKINRIWFREEDSNAEHTTDDTPADTAVDIPKGD